MSNQTENRKYRLRSRNAREPISGQSLWSWIREGDGLDIAASIPRQGAILRALPLLKPRESRCIPSYSIELQVGPCQNGLESSRNTFPYAALELQNRATQQWRRAQ